MAVVDGKVVFDETEQKEVDRIIGERLARAKVEKPADYDDLQEITRELADYGYTGSPAEIKAAIKLQKEQVKKQQELQDLQDEAEKDGISPALAKKIKDLETKLDEKTKALDEIVGERQAKKTESEKEKANAEQLQTELADFAKAYPDVDLNGMLEDKKFEKFVNKHAKAPVKEIYEDFVEFVGEAESAAIIKVKSKEERSTSGGKGNNSGGSYGLTNDQKTVVDNWNAKNPKMKMSYKEYAERL